MKATDKYDPADEKAVNGYARVIHMYRQQGPLPFIKDMWNLIPQGVKPEYKQEWETVLASSGNAWDSLKDKVQPHWFGTWNDELQEWEWYDFKKGTHITWQQTLILTAVSKGAQNLSPRHISVVSGHGIGKSATCSWIILWFLYCFQMSKVPVTAPTAHQMHDVLWSELSIWINRMPKEVSALYEWSSDHVRMAYDPEGWFARAKTSSKENTEALAGVHADHVCIVVDEASGVPDQVFNTAEGALTSGNVFVILISNGTQTTGYFYDSHHRSKSDWQNFSFNCENSPMVNKEYVLRQAKRHGKDSDEYKIRVKGGFPGENMMDLSGYMQLIPETKITVVQKYERTIFIGRKILGVDPSGEGKDKATIWLRDRFTAEKVWEEQTSNPKRVAAAVIQMIERYDIDPNDVVCDSLGIGADVGKEVALSSRGKYEIYTVLVGNKPDYEEEYNAKFFQRRDDEKDLLNDTDLYLNIRALMFFRARKWLFAGGVITDLNPENSETSHQFQSIKYLRSGQGSKIQLMSKKDMAKLGIKSPNDADAIALTMLRDLEEAVDNQTKYEKQRIEQEETSVDDPYSVL